MANVLFTRTSDPNSKPVTDGQLIFDTSGNGKMYLDNGTDRLEMGGALTVDATLSKTSTNPVQNKAVAGVMLDTLSDIGNVTSKGFLTDALAVKQLNTNVNELNNSLGGLKFGVDSDGNYGYIKAGADSVTPFKSEKRTYLIKDGVVQNGFNLLNPNGYILTYEDGYIKVVSTSNTANLTLSGKHVYIGFDGVDVTAYKYFGVDSVSTVAIMLYSGTSSITSNPAKTSTFSTCLDISSFNGLINLGYCINANNANITSKLLNMWLEQS